MAVLGDVDILSWLDQEESVKPAIQVASAHADTLTSEEVSGTCFEIQREVLLNLLEKAIGVVPARDIVPVMLNFQFQVAEDKLTVVATGMEMSIVVSTDQVDTKVAGTEVFPARTLLNIVKESNAGSTVYIEVTASGAVIVSGGFSAEIKMASGRDFPKMGKLDDVVFHSVDRAKFIEAISSVKYALPGKEFSGVAGLKMISIKGGKFTACDGSRFQQVRIDGFKLHMKLGSDHIPTLLKVLSASDMETLEIGELTHRLVFRLGNTVFYANKLEDPYPNVEQLWLRPALSNDQELVMDRQELITAIKQVKTTVDGDSNAIALILDSDKITIKARDTNNSASAVIGCKWAGKSRVVVVNYTHLAAMLKAYAKPECRFLLGEDTKTYKPPLLLKDDDTLAIATISQKVAYPADLV